ncbi:hypothetical protein LCM28_05585 [Salipiger pacificus]|nr:hypothetical protein [Alloyangia pacifica]
MPFTSKFERTSRIGKVMSLLARDEGATLREIAEAWERPAMPDAAVIQQVLRSEVAVKNRVRLQVDLREQRVRTTDHVRFNHEADLADLITGGYADETLFSQRAEATVTRLRTDEAAVPAE